MRCCHDATVLKHDKKQKQKGLLFRKKTCSFIFGCWRLPRLPSPVESHKLITQNLIREQSMAKEEGAARSIHGNEERIVQAWMTARRGMSVFANAET